MNPLSAEDVSALAAVEAAATEFPWSESQYVASFADGHFGWGEWLGSQCCGFVMFSRVLDEATLLNVVTHPDWRRRGIARELLLYALEALRQQGTCVIFLEVRVSNAGAIALYRQLGFVECGLRRGYYPAADGREDALVMQRSLVTAVV